MQSDVLVTADPNEPASAAPETHASGSDPVGENPAAAPPAAAARTRYEQQDRDITEQITAVLQLIDRIELNPQIAETLAGFGYDAERLAEGRALCTLAQDTFNRRQQLLNERKSLSSRLTEMDDALFKSFSDFRVIARALFRDSHDRRRLGVSGRRTRDRQRMLTILAAAGAAARQEPFLEALARHGYGAERLDALQAQAEALRVLDNEQDNAALLAREATSIRNEAAQQLQQWVFSLRSIAGRALRSSPELRSILDL